MARKQKPPPSKPSKAYLVSFGDTMTALLAFFIVLNSFSKEQTGANMYAGTGSFMNAINSIGVAGGEVGDKSRLVIPKTAPAPIYAIPSDKDSGRHSEALGPDDNPDDERIIDRQTESFKRFLTNINKSFTVQETAPTRTQIVFDSFEKFNIKQAEAIDYYPLKKDAIRIASEAIMKLTANDYKLEVIVWATMPSQKSLLKAMDLAVDVQNQIDAMFILTPEQRGRLQVSAKPWLFSDAIRPKMSFAISRLDLP